MCLWLTFPKHAAHTLTFTPPWSFSSFVTYPSPWCSSPRVCHHQVLQSPHSIFFFIPYSDHHLLYFMSTYSSGPAAANHSTPPSELLLHGLDNPSLSLTSPRPQLRLHASHEAVPLTLTFHALALILPTTTYFFALSFESTILLCPAHWTALAQLNKIRKNTQSCWLTLIHDQ